jgi:hypothetical protein
MDAQRLFHLVGNFQQLVRLNIGWLQSLPHRPQDGITGTCPTFFTRDYPQYVLKIDLDCM